MNEQRRGFGNTTQIGRLLHECAAGQDVREQLIQEVEQRLRRLASKMLHQFPRLRERGRSETGMILNDALVELHGSLGHVPFESPIHFINIAAQKMRYSLLDLVRKYKMELEAQKQAIESGERPHEMGVKHYFVFDEMETLLQTTKDLPEDQRIVFDMRWLKGMSRQEVATVLGVDEKTVSRRYGRATDFIAQRIKAEF